MEYNSLFMEELLGRSGFLVTCVDDGTDGLQAALEQAWDVIFLDWDLPSMNGLEIARHLKRDARHDPATLIIGMSASATKEMQDQCLDAGMSAFVPKPIDEEKLSEVLMECGLESGVESSETAEPHLWAKHGMLGEMSASEHEWQHNKTRWLGIFEEHVTELETAIAGGDPETIRQQAHKLLGHMRMVKLGDLPDHLAAIQEAVRNGSPEAIPGHWEQFQAGLDGFREDFRKL
jgi:CheY-like chemotaxis protein